MDGLRVLLFVCLMCGGGVRAQVYAADTWNASRVMRCLVPGAAERPASTRNGTIGGRPLAAPSAKTEEDRCRRVAPLLHVAETAAAASRRLAGSSALQGRPTAQQPPAGGLAALLAWLRDSGWPAQLCTALRGAHDRVRWCVKAVLPEPTYLEEWMRSSLVPKMRSGVLYLRGLIKSYDREKAALYMRTSIEKGIQWYKEWREETIKWVEESKIIEYSVMLILTIMTHVTLVWISLQTI